MSKPISAQAKSARRRGAAGTLVASLAFVLTACSLLVGGALLTDNLAARMQHGSARALAVGLLLVIVVAVPLAVGRALQQRLRAPLGKTLARTFAAYGGLLLLLALFGLPNSTRRALEAHGDWPLGGGGDASQTRFGRLIASLACRIPRTGPCPDPQPSPPAATAASSVPPSTPPAPVASVDLSPQELFALRADSVVVIRAQQPIPKGDPRSQLLRRLGIKMVQSAGSGFAVDHKGLIVTNYHVVEDARSLEVTRRDGTTFAVVELLATEITHDLALLRIADDKHQAAPLAPDDAVATGGRAIAIGSPLGLEYSLTDGIVSAVRDIQGTRFLQMQTTIAPGSSGGPLFDPRGRVIGVNTATQGAGLNLAVHVRHVRALLAKKRTRKKLRPYVAGPRVAKLSLKGAAMMPVTRMKLEETLELLAAGAEGCVDRVPSKPRLTMKFASRKGPLAGRSATVETNLGQKATRCLEGNLQLTGTKVAALLDESFASELSAGKPLTLAVDVAGVRGKKNPKGAEHTLVVRFSVPRGR